MNSIVKPNLLDITLRNTLLPGDLGYIAYVHGDLYAKECGYGLNFEAYVLKGLNDFAREYDALKDKVWICEHDNKIVGFLVAQHRDNTMQLRYFIFLPEYRGIGLGKKLMNEFIAFMRATGTQCAYLWTTNEQYSAITLYERYGFKLTEEKPSNSFDKELIERKYELVLTN
ncbi:MAG: GNAT family N-acetyltransferase [Mucilaginibacter sp.]|uniref:GNAT family N-acetyltransferase n=1 Tax=Mucilaginibacter sp. TaxID=1882438 RepID=UPI0031AB0789